MTSTERQELPNQMYVLAKLRLLDETLTRILARLDANERPAFMASDVFANSSLHEEPDAWRS